MTGGSSADPVLIFGATGQIGRCLLHRLAARAAADPGALPVEVEEFALGFFHAQPTEQGTARKLAQFGAAQRRNQVSSGEKTEATYP